MVISFRDADSVSAIGEFNNWSTVATPLNKIGEHEWELPGQPPNVEIERLGFFVIALGARSGRVFDYRNLIQT